ncbi:hypothetical protein AX774_g5209 [Zancudomyces culisetae]|uniref:Uncharacterized protein n=1 Tax=Zancudomyces culisetae TaxID=1213189 RepID=A0A1R1PK87_ZANCU|nr:hypothetical protein AX774_g5209 [Zancudomyces culisetae]|eukprot:OMH81333.1 hypothetical protein AX774_g5209 [Zancudomyces culisetae]
MGIMPRSPHAVRFGSPVYSSPKYVTQSGYSSPTGMVAHPGYISPPLYRSAQSPILSPMFASPIPVYNGQHVAHAPGSPYNGGYAVIGYGSPTNMSATDLGTSGYASPDYISPHLLSSPVYDMHPGYRPRFEQMPSGNTASDGHIQPLPIDQSSNPSHT